ncbi:hypothetical protein L7F22_006608 [Adiantum nelumboides]|nr:hypothetical protein [Adiantum nelumboides]
MSSSHYLSLVSAGAINGHHYPSQSIIADATLCPSSSFNVPENDIQQVAMLNNVQDSHQLFFAQFARAAGEEPKRRTGDQLSALSNMSQIVKVEGTADHAYWRADEHSQRSDIPSDQPMAEVCSSATAAADIGFQLRRPWPFNSNYRHDSLPSQARSAHYASDSMELLSMAAEAEDTERANVKKVMETEEQLAKMNHAEASKFSGHPLVKTAASLMLADRQYFSSGYDLGVSGRSNERMDVAYSTNATAGHGLQMSGWFKPLSSGHSLPGRPTLQENLQTTGQSISHEQLNTEYGTTALRGSSTSPTSSSLEQNCSRSLVVNAAAYAGDQDQMNGQQQGAEVEGSYFQRQKLVSVSESDYEHRLRNSGNFRVECTAGSIPTSTSVQSQLQQHITSGRTNAGWDEKNFPDMANAACKELLFSNHGQTAANIGASNVSCNSSILRHCSAAAAYDAETAGGVDTNTQQLLLRSSLLANSYNPVATLSKDCTMQLTDQLSVLAGGRHHFDTVGNHTSPNFPAPPAGNKNPLTFSQSFSMQPAQVETPNNSYMQLRPSAISSSSVITCNDAGHPAAAFCHQSTAGNSLLPIVDVTSGGLARYIQNEDLSLRRPSSDFFSLDCTFSRSGPVSVLRTSKYLKPAQQLLEEFCNVKPEYTSPRDRGAVGTKELSLNTTILATKQQLQLSSEERCHLQMRKARLIGMVEEVREAFAYFDFSPCLISRCIG